MRRRLDNNDKESYAVHHTVTNSDIMKLLKYILSNKAWLLDSECTVHVCGDHQRFKSLDECFVNKLNLAN